MNTKLLATIGLALTLGAAAADAQGSRSVRARVVGVQPIYRIVEVDRPVRACQRDYVERRVVNRPNTVGQTLAGAVVGAAIGRQFGSGRGQDAMTAFGALAGSAVANRRALRRSGGGTVSVVREPVERCTTRLRRETERQLTGYWVDYRYRGRVHRIRSRVHPGSHVRVVVGP